MNTFGLLVDKNIMFLGGLQFYYSQTIFGEIGLLDNNRNLNDDTKDQKKEEIDDNKTNSKVIIDRLIVIVIFSFSTIFFWWAFEQAGGSMKIFASDYTDRNLIGQGAFIFKVFNSVITIIPLDSNGTPDNLWLTIRTFVM